MLKLIKLEMKKIKMRGYIKGAFFSAIGILTMLFVFMFIDKIEGLKVLTDYKEAFLVIDVMVRVTFVIFASVLISRLIINEYKDNTISILFTYPINRKKLIMSKLLIVLVFTFLAIIISNIFIGSILVIIDSVYNIIPGNLTMDIINKNLLRIITNALSSSGMSLIPLYFGMRKKSASATIVSSILIATVINSNNIGFSLSSIIAIPISLAILGVLVAYLSIRNIEKVDI
ncbi:ABC transporter permease [Desnuesiella massiliensis]|uniref:ABC transporter permease n=1 Tax=Desnuesiella massiliensis TaxID=1650662 RepID=UPI0006E1E609|nr:ABC transporter permease [Desnuesiella massiliensis]